MPKIELWFTEDGYRDFVECHSKKEALKVWAQLEERGMTMPVVEVTYQAKKGRLFSEYFLIRNGELYNPNRDGEQK